MNKRQRYRHLEVDFVESTTVRHTVGVILQESKDDNSGMCLCRFREDREFLNKVPTIRFKSQPPNVIYSYGDVLLPACERLNTELAFDIRVEVIDQELKNKGKSDEDSIIIVPIRPGDPNILEQLRNRQPRIDPDDPESDIVFPYFSFTKWNNLSSNEHITIILSNLVKRLIENERKAIEA